LGSLHPHIRTGTLLGQLALAFESADVTAMNANAVSGTSSPYSLTRAISDLTTEASVRTVGTDGD
jgi:hypothetical protein